MLPIFHHRLERIRRREENRALVLHRRQLRDHSNPFEVPEQRFIELYRLNKDCARYLIDTISPVMVQGVYRNSIPNFIKIFASLRFYATGSYQRDIGLCYNVSLSQTSVHRCIRQVTETIERVIAINEIKFPTSEMEHNRMKHSFMHKFGFPGIIGCVDGTHIAILKPAEEAHNFYNRKGYYSLNVQIICDDNLKILHLNSNYPGSNHDSYIWRQTRIRQYLMQQFLENRLRGSWLIGDSGYTLEPFLMIPFLNPPDDSPEARYNQSHIRARNCIERCIGVWKCRFRACLQERTARYSPAFVGSLINVTAALHNLCIRFNVPLLERPLLDHDQAVPLGQIHNLEQNLQRQALDIRNNIVNQYF